MTLKEISSRELSGYSLLALPLAFAGLPLYLHAPDFYATEQEVSLGLLGLLLLLVRVFDAVQDPVIGGVSDHYPRQRGTIILFGTGLLALGMTALFMPPSSAGAGWFALWVIVASSAFSLVSINLNSLGGLWSGNHHERTRISSYRERFSLLGLSLGVIIPGILVMKFTREVAFFWFAVGLCCLLVFSAWRFYVWAKSQPQLFSGIKEGQKAVFKLRIPDDVRIRRLLLITLLGTLGSSLPAVLFLFFVRDQLQAEQWAWVYLVIYFVSALVGIPFWRDFSRSSGKVRIWCYTMLLATLSFVGALFVGEMDLLLYGIVCLATGFALGGDLVFPSSLMADYIGNSEDKRNGAGAGYAWLSFVQKAALGIAAGLAFPVLEGLGFETGTENPIAGTVGLVLLYAGVPLILKFLTIIMTWKSRVLLEGDMFYEKANNRHRRRTADDGINTDWMQQPYENRRL